MPCRSSACWRSCRVSWWPYQSADQLHKYGTNVFITDIISLSMLREFAPLMCFAAIGVVFSYFPARRAARMDPIEASQHE